MNNPSAELEDIVSNVREKLENRRSPPRATYRLQFHPEHFTFRDAAAVVPYLSQLGISHVYASPFLKVKSNSPHGYAIVDYSQLNAELGSEDDFEAFVAALHQHGMGQILDFVPNHMSAAPGENLWWTDVLENGPCSPYAGYFDINWSPVKSELKNRILLPVLGRQFGESLEAGDLSLRYDKGAFFIDYYETGFPLDPQTYAMMLTAGLDDLCKKLPEESEELRELESIITACEHLPDRNTAEPDQVSERQREKEVIKERLCRLTKQSAEILQYISDTLQSFNGTPGTPYSFDRLENLLDAQVYRLAYWKTAADEINYRRFFDINDLAAICMEDRDVFEDSHRFLFDLLSTGKVNGLRIDHVDGLLDPHEYFWRLQRGMLKHLIGNELHDLNLSVAENNRTGQEKSSAQRDRLESDALGKLLTESPQTTRTVSTAWRENLPLYVLVEKILGSDEPLPVEWPVAGTTGYDALYFLNGLSVDADGLRDLHRIFGGYAEEQSRFEEVAYQCKLLILRGAMSSELSLLAHRLDRIAEAHRLSRDFTLNSLLMALREILACFPVYRTYIHSNGISDRDRDMIQRAVVRARRLNPAMESTVFDFIKSVLLLQWPPGGSGKLTAEHELFIGRFQQVTSSVMAKGVEDTAFYRCYPLSSVNEVGAHPSLAAVSVEHFHEQNLQRRNHFPVSMICTSTHDTKRSEDVRARLNVLSEIPGLWRSRLLRWTEMNQKFHRNVGGNSAPHRQDEYLFYQSLLGIWPLHEPDEQHHQQLVDRIIQYMEKATHEAKVRTSWVSPNEEYDEAIREFCRLALDASSNRRFVDDFREFQQAVADCGLYSSLSQLLLKLTSPGVPDIYQGQELWDFSLVDPDNRRPVDYEKRRCLLQELQSHKPSAPETLHSLAGELISNIRDPQLKLFVTWRALQIRRQSPDLFRHGAYLPLKAEGTNARHICAFARTHAETDEAAVVVVPRLLGQITLSEGPLFTSPVGSDLWAETRIVGLQPDERLWKNAFTGEEYPPEDGKLQLAAVLADFPVALLVATRR